MPYKTGFIRLSFICSIFSTEEVGETSCHIADPAAIVTNPALILADWTTANLSTLATAYVTMMHASPIHWGDFSELTGVKAAPVGTDGHYTGEPLVLDGMLGTGAVAAEVYAQDSLVISLRTGSTFGTANYGRMFLPHSNIENVTSQPYFSPADATSASAHFATFIEAINTVAATRSAGDRVVNMSQKGTGTTKVVTRAGCGRVLDTQRRRRNRLIEDTRFTAIT